MIISRLEILVHLLKEFQLVWNMMCQYLLVLSVCYLTKGFFCQTLPRNHLNNLNEQNLACPIMDGRGNDIRHGSKHKKTHQTSSNNCNQTRKITHPLLNKRKPIVLLDLSQVNIWEFSDMSKFLGQNIYLRLAIVHSYIHKIF